MTQPRRYSQLQLTCCFTGVAIRLQQVARVTGTAVGALGIDTGLTARPTSQPPALIHILTASATALQLEALLTSTYLKEVDESIKTFRRQYNID